MRKSKLISVARTALVLFLAVNLFFLFVPVYVVTGDTDEEIIQAREAAGEPLTPEEVESVKNAVSAGMANQAVSPNDVPMTSLDLTPYIVGAAGIGFAVFLICKAVQKIGKKRPSTCQAAGRVPGRASGQLET